jgi:hypothetical protein
MATNKVRKFTELFELQTFLNGGLILGKVEGAVAGGSQAGIGAGIDNLVGKTLKFLSPAVVTVTFVTADGVGGSAEPGVGTNPNKFTLLFKDIKLQVEAAIAAVKVTSFLGRIVLTEATPASGVSLDKTGTSNAQLGVDSAVNTTGKFYNPPPSAVTPCWTFAYSDGSNSHTIYTLE